MTTLAVVPTYVTGLEDVAITLECLETLRRTAPDLEVLVVDDGSPDRAGVERLQAHAEQLDVELVAKDENEGFSRTVNVGLRRALAEGKDALLTNADLFFNNDTWLDALLSRTHTPDGEREAWVVGARLLYPAGLIQHAGIFMSLLHREFGHIYQYAPPNLPEAEVPRVCAVTGALQLVRHRALVEVGVYDEDFRMGHEDVDYCIRVFEAGGACVYEPGCIAIHRESMFRGQPSPKLARWHAESWATWKRKHARTNFAEWVPSFF